MRARVVGAWPDAGVTFAVRRGSFTIPLDVIARADATGDDYEIRLAYAANLPAGARIGRHEKTRDGLLRIYWRTITVVARYAEALQARDRVRANDERRSLETRR